MAKAFSFSKALGRRIYPTANRVGSNLFARRSLSFSAQYSGLETGELVKQPPAHRSPYASQLVHKGPILLFGLLLGPCQPMSKLLDPPLILPPELLELPLVVLSKLLELALVELCKVLEAPL